MNVCDISRDLEVVSFSGHTLSLEEQTVLKAALYILAENYKLDEIKFWGKVLGTSANYVIAVGYKGDPVDGKFLFASSNVMSGISGWFQLDAVDDTTKLACALLRGRFSGVKTKEYVISEGGEDAEEQTVNEATRLAYVIDAIDDDTHVVPKGALMQQPQGRVYHNRTFEGLPYEEAKEKGFYVHRRRPKHISYRKLASAPTIDKSIDFLDSLDNDAPQHWILRQKNAVVTLRNIAWPGSVAYHLPCSKTFGFSYFGYGEPNTDLGFVL